MKRKAYGQSFIDWYRRQPHVVSVRRPKLPRKLKKANRKRGILDLSISMMAPSDFITVTLRGGQYVSGHLVQVDE